MNTEAVKSFVAHIIAGVASATGMLLFVGVSQGDVTKLGAALQQIGDGIVSVFAGISVLIPLATGAYAAYKQTTAFFLKKANTDPEIEKIKTVPGTEAARIAASIPGAKIT